MARNEKKTEKDLDSLRNQSSLIVHGMDSILDNENNEIKGIVQQTIVDTKLKLGERTNGKPINYFNEINFGKAFNDIFAAGKSSKGGDKNEQMDTAAFKKYMEDDNKIDINALLLEDGLRSVAFSNYRIINRHIPECANALNIYKDNIMSPDDYTKLMFNITYDKPVSLEFKELVEDRLDDISLKYQLEEKADKIIEETLMLGESYLAVLSLEDELGRMLSDNDIKSGGILNEATQMKLKASDQDYISVPVLSESLKFSDDEKSTLLECFDVKEDELSKMVANIVNENVEIGSKREMLFERAGAELDKNKNLVDIELPSEKKKTSKKKNDSKPLFINGSSLRTLAPERVVELRVDDICYGYYYAEETGNNIANSTYLGASSGRDAQANMNVAQNNALTSTSSSTYTPAAGAARQLGIGEQKLRVISDVFLGAIASKIDKDFVRKNKQFKDFIYDLVKQDFIIKKGIKLTYFRPEEVIKFEAAPVYKDITFFAKLYLAILTNNLLIKLGRAHDKRIFYVSVGADAKYEEAINSVIQDIKTKDWAMEKLNDFNTLLNLTPGRFDDYFMPTVNGDRPIEIETVPGMDADMNNEFVEYLKNSMMSGMGVPRNLIDVTSEVDFARSISAMNANFVRSVIKYQKKLTTPFTRLYQKLYENEYRFVNDSENTDNIVDVSEIKVLFPSPATLAMSNLLDQLQAADQNADFIASQIVPMKMDQSTEEDRLLLKTKIVRDLVPSVDWTKYEKMYDEVKLDVTKDKVKAKRNPAPTDDMGFSGGY